MQVRTPLCLFTIKAKLPLLFFEKIRILLWMIVNNLELAWLNLVIVEGNFELYCNFGLIFKERVVVFQIHRSLCLKYVCLCMAPWKNLGHYGGVVTVFYTLMLIAGRAYHHGKIWAIMPKNCPSGGRVFSTLRYMTISLGQFYEKLFECMWDKVKLGPSWPKIVGVHVSLPPAQTWKVGHI